MLGFGVAALIAGAALAAYGLFGSTSVPASGFGRVVNLGLLGEQMALVMLGGSVMVVGAVFVAGATIAKAVADAEQAALAMMRKATQPAATPNAARVTSTPLLTKEDYDAGWAEVEAEAMARRWSFHRDGEFVTLELGGGLTRRLVGIFHAREYFELPPLAPKKPAGADQRPPAASVSSAQP
jgi:hypothetical protein